MEDNKDNQELEELNELDELDELDEYEGIKSPSQKLVHDSSVNHNQKSSNKMHATTSDLQASNLENDDASESEEYKRLMSFSTKKTKQPKGHFKKHSQKTRNDLDITKMHSKTSNQNRQRRKKFVVRKKEKRVGRDLDPEFTFKPKLNKKSLSLAKRSVYAFAGKSNVVTPDKDVGRRYILPSNVEKEMEEMRECSFTPNLKKTERLNRSLEVDKSPRHEVLYSKHERKLDRMHSKSVQKQANELGEWTFIPKVNNTTLSVGKFKKECVKQRIKRDKDITISDFATPSKASKPRAQSRLENWELFSRLYADSDRMNEKRRLNEVGQTLKQLQQWTFTPEKLNNIDYEYGEQYKDFGSRLYNNFFEVRDKHKFTKAGRDKELRWMSESRNANTINLSITNNFINSSAQLQQSEWSNKNSMLNL